MHRESSAYVRLEGTDDVLRIWDDGQQGYELLGQLF